MCLKKSIYQGARTQTVAIGDLNSDGKLDVATANAGHVDYTGSVSVLLQSTTPGVFLIAKNLSGISQPLSVAIDDANNDGLNDLAITDGRGYSQISKQCISRQFPACCFGRQLMV